MALPEPSLPRPKTRNSLIERVGWYLMGVAIGAILVGMIFQARAARTRRMQQQQQVQQAPPQAAPAGTPAP